MTPGFSYTKENEGKQKISIIAVIQLFTNKLIAEAPSFKKIWDPLVGENTCMTYFSSLMAKIIEDDLKSNKIDDLDFEKDPHQIVSDLIFAL